MSLFEIKIHNLFQFVFGKLISIVSYHFFVFF